MTTEPTPAQPEKVLEVCPKCGERSLHVRYLRGRDDYGLIEGEECYCERCEYSGASGGRC